MWAGLCVASLSSEPPVAPSISLVVCFIFISAVDMLNVLRFSLSLGSVSYFSYSFFNYYSLLDLSRLSLNLIFSSFLSFLSTVIPSFSRSILGMAMSFLLLVFE